MASQNEVDATLAVEALMDDVAPAMQSCTLDVLPGVPCTPQCLQSPPTGRGEAGGRTRKESVA
eukprot:5463648-Lingulodinium_polyedra.AAC.1